MLAIALSWLNSLELMRILALGFSVMTVVLLLVVRSCLRDYDELVDRNSDLKFKLGAMARKIRELAEQRDRAWINAAPVFRMTSPPAVTGPPVNSNGNGPVTVVNNFAQAKETPMDFPKDLNEVQESLKKGEKLMSKMRSQKGLIREVGFLRAVTMFGLLYVLASMIRKTWDRIKHRFEEDGKTTSDKRKEKENPDWED